MLCVLAILAHFGRAHAVSQTCQADATLLLQTQVHVETEESRTSNRAETGASASPDDVTGAPLWPLKTWVLTVPGRKANVDRFAQLERSLHHGGMAFQAVYGDVVTRHKNVGEQLRSLGLPPDLWVDHKDQKVQLKLSAELVKGDCNVTACMLQARCICVTDSSRLPADVDLSITLTHFDIWRAALSSDLPEDGWLLVLEDDTVLSSRWHSQHFKELMIPRRADYVFLGGRSGHSGRCRGGITGSHGQVLAITPGNYTNHETGDVLTITPDGIPLPAVGEEAWSMGLMGALGHSAGAYALRKSAARRVLSLMPRGLPELPSAGLVIDYFLNALVLSEDLTLFCPKLRDVPFGFQASAHKTSRILIKLKP